MDDPRTKTDEQWRDELDSDQFAVLRNGATEAPFTGKYWNTDDDGIYRCVACGTELFDSETKFDSGSGWPSFSEPLVVERIALRQDESHGMTRTEVICRNCDGHLGHVFDDGPADAGGKRYCINSCALEIDKGAKRW